MVVESPTYSKHAELSMHSLQDFSAGNGFQHVLWAGREAALSGCSDQLHL